MDHMMCDLFVLVTIFYPLFFLVDNQGTGPRLDYVQQLWDRSAGYSSLISREK